MSIWVPPAMSDRGWTPVRTELLLDLGKLPHERHCPPPGASVVYDEAYTWLRKAALIHKLGEGFSSYYVLSTDGIGKFNEYHRLVESFERMMGIRKTR